MKRGKRILVISGSLLLLLVTYVSSYLMISAQGQYEELVTYGPGRADEDGRSHLIPKATGYRWIPFQITNNTLWRFYLYSPLALLDQKLWHTDEKAEFGQYPTCGGPGSLIQLESE